MNVLVERYQRRKYVNQENAPMLYYIRQKSGNVRVMDIDTMATAIESKSALTAGDVKHTIEAFVEQLRASLTQGDKVKIDGLGTFHITLTSDGTELMKECTVRSIRRVNVRFVADKALKLMNASHTSTRSENNVDFVLGGRVTKTEAETAAMVETAVRAATLPEGMMETRHRTRQFKTVNYTWRGDFSSAMFFSLI